MWASTRRGFPWKWWNHHPCKCLEGRWIWHLRTWFCGEHSGAGLRVGFSDLTGLFQNYFFYDSLRWWFRQLLRTFGGTSCRETCNTLLFSCFCFLKSLVWKSQFDFLAAIVTALKPTCWRQVRLLRQSHKVRKEYKLCLTPPQGSSCRLSSEQMQLEDRKDKSCS